ncbi:EPIDERMAL PATTERNING FACTOR-like protein 3 [Silene latifolia]|uniref:EPIDERMAL PATTERNING FACTOR-like protein 3 n=1 Tax=Silene latifolia TaxID=37657 RepID=UPI003D782A14
MMIKFLSCLALLLHVMAWFPAASRHLPPTSLQPGTVVSPENVEASYSSKQVSEPGSYKGMHMNQLGSRPPTCEGKCDGCNPCIAIKVPTITSHVGIQFANYEPESWKCKCGPSVYTP